MLHIHHHTHVGPPAAQLSTHVMYHTYFSHSKYCCSTSITRAGYAYVSLTCEHRSAYAKCAARLFVWVSSTIYLFGDLGWCRDKRSSEIGRLLCIQHMTLCMLSTCWECASRCVLLNTGSDYIPLCTISRTLLHCFFLPFSPPAMSKPCKISAPSTYMI